MLIVVSTIGDPFLYPVPFLNLRFVSSFEKELVKEKRACFFCNPKILHDFQNFLILKRQPIKLNDLKYCKLFGLSLLITKDDKCCSPDCYSGLNTPTHNTNPTTPAKPHHYKHSHVHYHHPKSRDDTDLMLKFLPITIRNYISILDLDKGTFLGPRYDGQHLINAASRCKQLKQDSICYLFLMSRVVKFYIRTAFIYNYSVLFDDFSDDGSRSRLTSTAAQAASNRTTRTNSITSFDAKRERIIRYFSANSQYSSVLNNLSSVKEPAGFSFLRSRQNSETTSLSSLASSFISINEAEFQRGPVGLFNRRRSSAVGGVATRNDELELLRIVLAVVGQTSGGGEGKGAKAVFSQSDFNIVSNILRTLSLKQIWLYELMMRCKREREERLRKGGAGAGEGKRPERAWSEEIPAPLFLDYDDVSLIRLKR